MARWASTAILCEYLHRTGKGTQVHLRYVYRCTQTLECVKENMWKGNKTAGDERKRERKRERERKTDRQTERDREMWNETVLPSLQLVSPHTYTAAREWWEANQLIDPNKHTCPYTEAGTLCPLPSPPTQGRRQAWRREGRGVTRDKFKPWPENWGENKHYLKAANNKRG